MRQSQKKLYYTPKTFICLLLIQCFKDEYVQSIPLQILTWQICPYETVSPLKPASYIASIYHQTAQVFSTFCQQAL